jgi:hypothetical protein
MPHVQGSFHRIEKSAQPLDILRDRGARVVFPLCEDFISVSFPYIIDLLDRFMHRAHFRR